MDVKIEPSWKQALQNEFNKPYFEALANFVKYEYLTNTVYPPGRFIFNAFNSCPFDQVKVVILGQDPYHGPKQAHGLSFSVPEGISLPPSLQNIYKEIHSDLSQPISKTGDLTRWAKQGVLLLNATLTVKANQAASHQNQGWEAFTDAVIKTLSDQRRHLVFLLWGGYAKKKVLLIDLKKHFILTAAHPSPLSAHNGFFGSKPFSQTNQYLKSHHLEPINW